MKWGILGYFVKYADSNQYIIAYKNDVNNLNATTTIGKIGDSIKELRNNMSKTNSWSGDKVMLPINDKPFSIRGGYINDSTDAGIFCAGYNKGSGSGNKSFRTVLIIDN